MNINKKETDKRIEILRNDISEIDAKLSDMKKSISELSEKRKAIKSELIELESGFYDALYDMYKGKCFILSNSKYINVLNHVYAFKIISPVGFPHKSFCNCIILTSNLYEIHSRCGITLEMLNVFGKQDSNELTVSPYKVAFPDIILNIDAYTEISEEKFNSLLNNYYKRITGTEE